MYKASFNQESLFQQNSKDTFTHGYHYDKPGINFAQVDSPISIDYQKRQQFEFPYLNNPDPFGQGPLRLEQKGPNEYINEFAFPITQNDRDRLPIRTTGDDQGAFISSDIFGSDFDSQNFTISATGLIIPNAAFGGGAFGGGISISCNEPYQKPRMPDFRYPGLRISDVSKY